MIKVVPKIITILELFSAGREIDFADVMRETGLTRSNVSHLLSTLCECAILERTGYGIYRRGKRLMKLCGTDNESNMLADAAGRCADNVTGTLNELAVVAVRHGIHRITIAKRRPTKNIQVQTIETNVFPADWYGTSCGRVLLAFAPREITCEIVRHYGLPMKKEWPEAVTLPKLNAELESIRKKGYAEYNVDKYVRAVGVPARDAGGNAALAVSTAYPVFGCELATRELVRRLEYAAGQLAKELEIHGISISEIKYETTPKGKV